MIGKLPMSEKLTRTPEASTPRENNGEHQVTLEALERRVLDLLRSNGRSLTAAELTAAVNEGNGGRVEQRHIRVALDSLRGRGKIEYFSRRDLENQPALAVRAETLLEATREPMSVDEIITGLGHHKGKAVNRKYLIHRLYELQAAGRIKRLRKGFYAWSGFNENSYDLRRIDKPCQKILDVLGSRPDEIFSPAAMARELTTLTGIEICRGHVGNYLRYLWRQGQIQRLDRGQYANLDCSAEGYERPLTISELIIKALESARQPLTRRQIADYAQANTERESLSHRSIAWQLTKLVNAGRILRLHEGVYARAEFDREQYEQPPTITSAIADILRQSTEPLHIDEITERLNAQPGRAVSKKRVKDLLWRLIKREQAQNLRPGSSPTLRSTITARRRNTSFRKQRCCLSLKAAAK